MSWCSPDLYCSIYFELAAILITKVENINKTCALSSISKANSFNKTTFSFEFKSIDLCPRENFFFRFNENLPSHPVITLVRCVCLVETHQQWETAFRCLVSSSALHSFSFLRYWLIISISALFSLKILELPQSAR